MAPSRAATSSVDLISITRGPSRRTLSVARCPAFMTRSRSPSKASTQGPTISTVSKRSIRRASAMAMSSNRPGAMGARTCHCAGFPRRGELDHHGGVFRAPTPVAQQAAHRGQPHRGGRSRSGEHRERSSRSRWSRSARAPTKRSFGRGGVDEARCRPASAVEGDVDDLDLRGARRRHSATRPGGDRAAAAACRRAEPS